jgi:hypothetical protein
MAHSGNGGAGSMARRADDGFAYAQLISYLKSLWHGFATAQVVDGRALNNDHL